MEANGKADVEKLHRLPGLSRTDDARVRGSGTRRWSCCVVLDGGSGGGGGGSGFPAGL